MTSCGVNVDLDAVGHDLDDMARRLAEEDIVTVLVPLPDMTGLLPIGARLKGRVDAFNSTLADVAGRRGALLAPLPPPQVFGRPEAWSSDRLHLSPLGHSRFALGMLHTLGLPTPSPWDEPLAAGLRAGLCRTRCRRAAMVGRVRRSVDRPTPDRSLIRRRPDRQTPGAQTVDRRIGLG